jgi:hypothetical protein
MTVAVPQYGHGTLGDLLPAALASLGIPVPALGTSSIELPAAPLVCVLLVDGLGSELINAANKDDAPFLRSLSDDARVIQAGFPASTPISLCSLGTGRTPGEHGIVGFTMHEPGQPHVLQCLTWVDYADGRDLLSVLPPETLQPIEPLFGLAELHGLVATVMSLRAHAGSGLTRAAFRGARLVSFERFEDTEARAKLLEAVLLAGDRALVYTYDNRLDTAAHHDGIGSDAWRHALRETDDLVRALAATIGSRGLLIVTGDHGGRNVSTGDQIDLAASPQLARGVAYLSGEPRARFVHAQEGLADAVLATWTEELGDGWTVMSRDAAVRAGLFGPTVRPDVLPRIGDVVAIATGGGGVFDRSRYPWELPLRALHGALTSAELLVPLIVVGG